MKRKYLLGMATVMTLLVGGMVMTLAPKSKNLFTMNLEALTQGEATITCDSGNYGLCHRMAYDSYLWGTEIYYYCEWTGHQADNCPISVYLLNRH